MRCLAESWFRSPVRSPDRGDEGSGRDDSGSKSGEGKPRRLTQGLSGQPRPDTEPRALNLCLSNP